MEHMHSTPRCASSRTSTLGIGAAGSPSMTAKGLISSAILTASAFMAASSSDGPLASISMYCTSRP